MKTLLSRAGSFPFLTAVFLNAFVDLGHKIVIQNTIFKIHDGSEQVVLTAILNSLILLPFILLFIPAGRLSDTHAKHQVMRITAWAAVALTMGITVCYALGWFWASFVMTFLLAAQSALYSPAKLGYIRGFFGKDHLAQANGIVSATTIIAILAGTFAFSIVFEAVFPQDAETKSEVVANLIPVGFILMATAVFELIMVYRLPQCDTPLTSSEEKSELPKETKKQSLIKEQLGPVIHRENIRLSIIGLAMFWSIGQVMLAAFPAFAKAQTGEVNTIVIQAILGASGLGIALGSVIASRVSRNYIETGLIPIGAAGIALGLAVLPTLSNQWLMGLDFLFIGAMGGMFIVPLNSLIQYYAQENELGKVLAGNNLIQNISMFAFLMLTVSFALLGIGSKHLLILIAFVAFFGGLYTVYKLPQSLVRIIMSIAMSSRYRVTVHGMKNIPNQGGVLLLGNHISWIDWAIVQLASPRPVQFVMLKRIYETWYLKWFFKLFGCVPIERGSSSKASLETVAELLNEGKVVCLFPEGAISRTGHLGEFRRGFERAASMCNNDVVIQPFYLRGLWGSQWSYSSEKMKAQSNRWWKRDLLVAFGKPESIDMKADELKRRVFDLSISSWQEYADNLPNIAHSVIDRCKSDSNALAVGESNGQELTRSKLLTASICFARKIKRISPEQNIGLLAPTSAGGVIANLSTLLLGKTIVNLNYSASNDAMASALEQASIQTIYTSKRFISKLESRGIDFSENFSGKKIVFLEELKNEIGKTESLLTYTAVRLLPSFVIKSLFSKKTEADSTAAILFSSGSEGTPKGICLSHTNILANLKQISDVLNMKNDDVMMASLPLFHAFGLTVTQFLPLVEGLPMICHPDPTDVLGISKAVAKYRGTIMCGTSTFLRLYARNNKVNPLMLKSLRLVIAGAEKLNPEVRNSFKEKFNLDILEGYGATETTPVASVNLPNSLDTNSWSVQLGEKTGTVGMPLPGTSFKIVDPETWQELSSGHRGMILIGGAQVMKGYLNDPNRTEQSIKIIDGRRWYVTGDKGYLDEDGFLTIVDRYSRFAKLGGEMISLSSVENAVCSSLSDEYTDLQVVAVNVADDKKGEKIILLSERDISLAEVKQAMIANKHNALMIPSQVLQVESLPMLGSGKIDFSKAKSVVIDRLNEAA